MADDQHLIAVLESLRERGALGEASLAGAIAHAESFVAAVPQTAQRLLDLGSGGGLPGLVIAVRRPDLRMVLCDRRERRMDLLRRAGASLDLDGRVEVVTGDVRDLARQPHLAGQFDVVTARAFGEPMWVLACARPFLREHGVVIVSEPPPISGPTVDVRWPVDEMARLGFVPDDVVFPQVRRLTRLAS